MKLPAYYQDSELCAVNSGSGNGALDTRPQSQPDSPVRVPPKTTPRTDEERELLARIAPLSFGRGK